MKLLVDQRTNAGSKQVGILFQEMSPLDEMDEKFQNVFGHHGTVVS